ncbi:MAG: DUF1501 domain-containing protein [Planctomycetaceae bacterium]|nr:DUF1501 domain-containing protein [Planctomycetaceae bacterium]
MSIQRARPRASGNLAPTRRGLLRAGVLSLGGLTLADVFRLRAAASTAADRRPKAIIMIHLSGGPSHVDMYDLKPDAPVEYRGEFRPIRTNVPGIEICELMPRQAQIADRLTILRGVQLAHLHTANEFYSGFPWQETPRASVPGEAKRPALGAVVSRVRGGGSAIPPYVSLDNQSDWERSYYLGPEFEPFRLGGNSPRETMDDMGRSRDVDRSRLGERARLLHSIDTIRRELDRSQSMSAIDAFQERALDIVTSGQVREAFDVEREPQHIRARYGEKPFPVIRQECVKNYHDQGHPGRSLLRARRLIEAGVSVVTYCVGGWDTHRYNFETLRAMLPPLDQALSALILDLEERGLLEDVAVLMGGEFGRTPRIGDITPDGRSHWPEAGFLWIAGGGLRTGQVIGGTDDRGEHVIGTPIRMQNVLATMYHVLGIDPATTFPDHNGRPQYVLEERDVVPGLV